MNRAQFEKDMSSYYMGQSSQVIHGQVITTFRNKLPRMYVPFNNPQ